MRSKLYIKLLAIISMILFPACDDFIYEDEGDCTTVYQLNFVYDYNMKFANAFAHEVKSVSAYLFDESGTLAYTKSESISLQNNSDYKMNLDVEPGTYEVLAWCGVSDSEHYTLPKAVVGQTKKEDLTCWLNRESQDGKNIVDKQLPFLFHGIVNEAHFPLHSGIHTVDVNLVKNTNTVKIVLQHLSGEPVDAALFDFEITDDNGWMNWDNSLKADDMLTYKPWSVTQGSASLDKKDGSRTLTEVGVAVAELTINRLMTNHRTILSVYNKKTNEKVLSVPLTELCLLVKGNYNKAMTDQEYLDRQDDYSLVFFLDEGVKWASASVYINSWRVVLHDAEL